MQKWAQPHSKLKCSIEFTVCKPFCQCWIKQSCLKVSWPSMHTYDCTSLIPSLPPFHTHTHTQRERKHSHWRLHACTQNICRMSQNITLQTAHTWTQTCTETSLLVHEWQHSSLDTLKTFWEHSHTKAIIILQGNLYRDYKLAYCVNVLKCMYVVSDHRPQLKLISL